MPKPKKASDEKKGTPGSVPTKKYHNYGFHQGSFGKPKEYGGHKKPYKPPKRKRKGKAPSKEET